MRSADQGICGHDSLHKSHLAVFQAVIFKLVGFVFWNVLHQRLVGIVFVKAVLCHLLIRGICLYLGDRACDLIRICFHQIIVHKGSKKLKGPGTVREGMVCLEIYAFFIKRDLKQKIFLVPHIDLAAGRAVFLPDNRLKLRLLQIIPENAAAKDTEKKAVVLHTQIKGFLQFYRVDLFGELTGKPEDALILLPAGGRKYLCCILQGSPLFSAEMGHSLTSLSIT